MKPLIGVLGRLATIDSGAFNGLERVNLTNAYVDAIEKAGGVPIVVPVNTNKENIKAQVSAMDGIIISGGDDVNPNLYKEEPVRELGYINPIIDEFDIEVIKVALEMNKPILGICRGLQVLNVALGGSLYQDLKYIKGSHIKHNQETKTYLGTHYIDIKENSILKEIIKEKVLVNSYHHQSVKTLGNNLKVIAYSNDGIIEAVQKENEKFVLGVQWHPELMVDYSPHMLNLFKRFVDECR
ncbi:gamma-glutamyl-gamma-aminobutyrate hydrolase family protein [Paraclostridium tenue]|uniref:Gamma-glutamyl-gamma-aminobutyrate hydrolase family protein n=1 Tax=Paraclostridium tenue TaxID=1737 RepID=A0ABP3XEE3_9FIRM